MPWLTPEEVLSHQAAADYDELAFECGAIEPLTSLTAKEAFLHGWWAAHGMGNATLEAYNSFCEKVDRLPGQRALVSGETHG